MSTTPEDIESNATGPKKVSDDSGSMEQHSIEDQIRAYNFKKSQEAASGNNPGFGVRFQKIQPPGNR